MTLTYNLSEIDSIAKQILAYAEHHIILLNGAMGVGKTTLTKAICHELGVKEETVSPTFSIVNEYEGKDSQTIYHFDLYRLNKPEELLDIGFEDYLAQADWILIEWPEKMGIYYPDFHTSIEIKHSNELNRQVTVNNKC